MRAGWNRYLRDLLWAPDAKAQLIVQAIEVEQEETKDSATEWGLADSLAGLLGVTRGGLQLAPTGQLALDYSVAPDADISTLGPTNPMSALFVQWLGAQMHDGQLKNVVLRVNPKVTGAAREVAEWVCRAYRVAAVGPDGEAGSQRVELTPISGGVHVIEAGNAVHDITFNFVQDGRGAMVGDPPELRTDDNGQPGTDVPLSYPITVIALFAYKSDGSIAGNCSWRGKAGAGPGQTNAAWIATHNTITAVDDTGRAESNAGSGGAYTLSSQPTTFPWIQVNRQTFAAATATFTAVKISLPDAVAGALYLIALGEELGDSALTWYISSDAGSHWYPCSDGDQIGIVNTHLDAHGNTVTGNDLTAVAIQQTYSLKVTLTPSSSGFQTPVARRFGVQELALVDLAGATVVDGVACGVDPLTGKAEISQPSISIVKTGERDYRDYGSSIFASHHIGQVQLRVLIGHPDLARKYWLHLDTFDVEDTIPGDSQITALCLSLLGRLRTLGRIPFFDVDASPHQRTPVVYQGETIAAVYADMIDSQIALPGRLRGVGPSATDVLSKTIKDSDPKDELDAVAFLGGCAVISSQGRIKAVQMFDEPGNERPPVAWFSREEYKPLSITPGFRTRIDEYFVKFGWNEEEGDWDDEAYGAWVVAGLAELDAKLRSRGIESRGELDDEVAKWIDGVTLAKKVAGRMVRHFATGMMPWEIYAIYPHPFLEPGDVVVVQTDQFVARDPVTDREVKGVIAAKGVVSMVHDAMGHHLTIWIKSFADIIVSDDDVTRVGFVKPQITHAEVGVHSDGTPYIQVQTTGAGSVRALADPSNFQGAGDILLASAHAVDGFGWVQFDLAGTYALGDDVYVSALAYETPAGGGAVQFTPTTLKVTYILTGNQAIVVGHHWEYFNNVVVGDIGYSRSGWKLKLTIAVGPLCKSLQITHTWDEYDLSVEPPTLGTSYSKTYPLPNSYTTGALTPQTTHYVEGVLDGMFTDFPRLWLWNENGTLAAGFQDANVHVEIVPYDGPVVADAVTGLAGETYEFNPPDPGTNGPAVIEGAADVFMISPVLRVDLDAFAVALDPMRRPLLAFKEDSLIAQKVKVLGGSVDVPGFFAYTTSEFSTSGVGGIRINRDFDVGSFAIGVIFQQDEVDQWEVGLDSTTGDVHPDFTVYCCGIGDHQRMNADGRTKVGYAIGPIDGGDGIFNINNTTGTVAATMLQFNAIDQDASITRVLQAINAGVIVWGVNPIGRMGIGRDFHANFGLATVGSAAVQLGLPSSEPASGDMQNGTITFWEASGATHWKSKDGGGGTATGTL